MERHRRTPFLALLSYNVSMARREFFLLGSFRATVEGEPLTGITSPKFHGLLAYLALGPPGPRPRPQVAALLWPERPAARAAQSLRQAIYRLNKLLALPDLPDPLLATRHTVALNEEAELWFDAAALMQTLQETAAHEHAAIERCPPCCARLEAAVAHYRGPLLAGVEVESEPFEEWLRPRRDGLERQALEALGHLVTFHEGRGAYERAEAFARRQIEVAPWHERGHRQLMRALAAQGRRGAALAQYERMAAALAELLDVAPAESSRALAESVRDGTFMRRRERRPRRNLPPQHTPFVGRTAEMAKIGARLEDAACHLLTLVGPGGAGKSRLAIETARAHADAFADGAVFVPLAATGAENVATTILAALAIPLLDHEEGGAERRLVQALRERDLLLILDNYEHLLPETGLMRRILQEAPGVQLLVTSRQRLGLRAEWVVDVAGLPYRSSGERATAEQAEAEALFKALARRLNRDFADGEALEGSVTELCRLVGGLPLALELASAWVRELPVAAIVDGVSRNLDFLETEAADVDPRHRGLRAVFNHSWSLLEEAEQATLCRLAIFRGDFTVRSAAAVAEASPDMLDSLVGKSLVQAADGRYRLHAVLHQYMREKLNAQPSAAATTAAAHSSHYLDLLQQTATAPARVARAAVAADIENVRAAWRHATLHRVDELLPALPGLVRFYIQASYLEEGHATLAESASRLQGRERLAPNLLRLQAHLASEKLYFTYGLARYDEVRSEAEEALRLGAEAGEEGLIANVVAKGNMYLGAALARQGAYAEAGEIVDTAREMAEKAGEPRLVADTLRLAGQIAVRLGSYARAERLYAQSLDVARRAGYARGEGHALGGLGNVALVQEAPVKARAHYEAALAIFEAAGEEVAAATVRQNLGTSYWAVGDYVRAAAIYEENLAVRRRAGDRRGEGASLLRLAIQDHYSGDLANGRRRYEAALAIFQEIGYRRGEGEALAHLCLLLHQEGDNGRAVALGRRAEGIARDNHDRSDLGYALTFLGHALAAEGQNEAARAAYEEARALRQQLGERNRALEPRAGLAEVALAAGQLEAALAHAKAIVAHLEKGNLDVVDEPARVYLAAVRALRAAGDARAEALLREGQAFVRARAALLGERGALFLQRPMHVALLEGG